MSESTAGVDQKTGLRARLSQLFQKKEAGSSEEELRVSAFNHYVDRLASLKDSPLREDGQTIKSRVRSLVVDFEEEKKKNPSLTENSFVETRANGRSLISIASSGWNPEDSHLQSFLDRPVTKERTWDLDRVVDDLLGETGFVDIDAKFTKSDSPFFPGDNIAYDAIGDKSTGMIGTHTLNGRFTQWSAAVTNEDEKAAGISVALKREDKARLSPHVYLTGREGGVRAYKISIDNKTLASVIHAGSAGI